MSLYAVVNMLSMAVIWFQMLVAKKKEIKKKKSKLEN